MQEESKRAMSEGRDVRETGQAIAGLGGGMAPTAKECRQKNAKLDKARTQSLL